MYMIYLQNKKYFHELGKTGLGTLRCSMSRHKNVTLKIYFRVSILAQKCSEGYFALYKRKAHELNGGEVWKSSEPVILNNKPNIVTIMKKEN